MGVISPERLATNELLRQWGRLVTGSVLSIGSGGDIDKEGGWYRDYFAFATAYVTSDIDPAMKCDLTLDAQWMPVIESGSFNAVFCSGVLEHVSSPASVVDEVHRVLTDGGLWLVGVPFKQPIHRAPGDYWRFTEFGLRELLERRFRVTDIVPIGDPTFPFGYWARAVKVRS